MMPIRIKLLLFFAVIVMLSTGVVFYLYDSSKNIMNEYNQSFQRFLLLNEISQQTNQTTEAVNAFIVEKDKLFMQKYTKLRAELLKNNGRLEKEVENPKNHLLLQNYQNMIESFITECDLTISTFSDGEMEQYPSHYNQAVKISNFIVETTLSLINSELTSYQNFYDQLLHQNTNFKFMTIFLVVSLLILCTLLAIIISGGITKPIQRLSLAAQEISAGQFSGADIKVSTNDELKLLTETFNEMRKNIRRLVKEIKDKSELDKLLKELELKSLQNQINPHFLFNTLNTIAKMAYLENAHETTKLIESVSVLLRYNFVHLEQPTTLEDEISFVKEYFTIQRTRFSDRIVFEMNIDESCLKQPIPRMTLQPIIENAFIHGIENHEEGARLAISIYKKENQVYIDVIDNGAGMDEDTRQRLLHLSESRPENNEKSVHSSGSYSSGIGVKNVIKRLEIFFREKEMVEIESKLGKGTLFRIKLPKVD
ncbi:histidine kinase [Neobacillus sp. OS1-32]|uniref:histidine kinase n=1 Tax=Neobacillus paridis TaxID=2803862 RepID=A0ABS1TPK2_9BACI|nr:MULTISPECIES: histidine kinase [Neobacillus]MBL4952969.1 histidine kinase [Neobacillus paridis]WML31511.1 histidine kinase [Neobacillus sp. OS1-32]